MCRESLYLLPKQLMLVEVTRIEHAKIYRHIISLTGPKRWLTNGKKFRIHCSASSIKQFYFIFKSIWTCVTVPVLLRDHDWKFKIFMARRLNVKKICEKTNYLAMKKFALYHRILYSYTIKYALISSLIYVSYEPIYVDHLFIDSECYVENQVK